MGLFDAHWLTSAVLAGSFLLGILSAGIHDHIYAQYADQYVESQSQQEWLGRAGTALAFLVKTLFSAAVGISCIQRLWWTLRNKSTSIKTIDSSLNIVQNPFDLMNWRLFTEVPLIVLLAAVSWLMPVAALFAPPTLTVLQDAANSTTLQQFPIPAIDFGAKFIVIGGNAQDPPIYMGPQPELERIAMQVALSGQPSTFNSPGPYQNATYNTKFYGPYFSCGQADQSVHDMLNETATALGDSPIFYASWLPYFNTGTNNVTSKNLLAWLNASTSLQTLDEAGKTSAGLFVATLNYTFDSTFPNSLQSISAYECNLHNASYDVNFHFLNGIGTHVVNNISVFETVAFPASPFDTPTISYVSMLDAMGQILVGGISTNKDRQMFVKQTEVLKTFLATAGDFPKPFNFFQFEDSLANKTIGTVLEELMTNITISLFTLPQYLEDTSPMATVTVTTMRNIYHYAQWQLLTSYGIAAAATLCSVMVGFWCLHSNSAAYSNNFSTILRVTRYSQLDQIIDAKDTSGVSPTPAYIGDVKVSLAEVSDGVGSSGSRYAMMTESAEDLGAEKMEEDFESQIPTGSSASLPLLEPVSPVSPASPHMYRY